MTAKPNLLITNSHVKGRFEDLSKYAHVYWLEEISSKELDSLLPTIDCILVQSWWPDALTPERLSRMTKLRFVQSGWAGVNHIPFGDLGKHVKISSNAGGFSVGVAEYAIALMLAAAKRVVKLDHTMRTGDFDATKWERLVSEVGSLSGRTLGILGFGGIGQATGSMGKGLGMDVIAFSRREGNDPGVPVLQGRKGLLKVLRSSDIVVIALPLSKLTLRLIGPNELAAMKSDAVLVNIARAEIVDEEALYIHLIRNPGFTYATDVWRMEGGKETYSSKFPLLKLPNFIGTPHVAGGSTSRTGDPAKRAEENLLQFLEGEEPRNQVDRSECL